MTSAVVFAYHDVGVKCLSVLLAHGVKVALVVTHEDNPAETLWFDSVTKLAAAHHVPTIAPDDPNTSDVVERIGALKPDFLFSFYYRNMLKPALLSLPRCGALNMHGSLLPKYRGRVPVNWAVIRGETETGATLHYMTAKPDAGDIVAQRAVPILPDETAAEVMRKVADAAAALLDRIVPSLLTGTAPRVPQDLARGAYFGGRKPADGLIDWQRTAREVHNLVRGVAPPYPGAFTMLGGKTLKILRTQAAAGDPPGVTPAIYADGTNCMAACADGSLLRILAMEYDGRSCSAADFLAQFGAAPIPLEAAQ